MIYKMEITLPSSQSCFKDQINSGTSAIGTGASREEVAPVMGKRN